MVSEEQFKDLSVKEKSTRSYPVMSETTPRVAENSSCCSSASVDVCGCVLGGGTAACMSATCMGECQRGL